MRKISSRPNQYYAVNGRSCKFMETPFGGHALFQIWSNLAERCFVLVRRLVPNFNFMSPLTLELLTFPFRGTPRKTVRGREWTRPAKFVLRIPQKVLYKNYEGSKKIFFIGPRLRWKVLGTSCTTRASSGPRFLGKDITNYLESFRVIEYKGRVERAVKVTKKSQYTLTLTASDGSENITICLKL